MNYDETKAKFAELHAHLDRVGDILQSTRAKHEAVMEATDYTRLKTIERAALALLVNKRDLGMYSIREPLMADLEKAFGPYDPKQHKVQFP